MNYWHNQFDWRAQEAKFNRFAQFRADIDGFAVHYIHERGTGAHPLPIILLHGWPDSFFRFHKVIALLTDPASHGGDPADSFDVMVPSLPGFGFSDRPHERGGSDTRMLFARLMTDVLGYARFGAHGGDTGSPIAQELALKHPESVVGIHLTDIGWQNRLGADTPNPSEAEQAYRAVLQQWSFNEGGYVAIQGTKPQTLAYGLNDSPAGLAAWIVEKFRTWSDCDGNVERRFTKDELLTNIMIYWATETINSSIRGYYEGMHGQPAAVERSTVPVGLALFPKDNPPPRETVERNLNVQHWTEMLRGGHFAALEEPELLVEDVRAFFRPLRATS